MNRLRLVVLPVIVATCSLAALAAGCGVSGASAQGDIRIEEAWTRPTPPGAQSTAFYATILNESGSDDRVVGATSSLCGMAELHLSTTTDGVMSMSPAGPDDLALAPDDELRLEPGGLHVMCMGLTGPVDEGDEVELTVEFEEAGTITVQAAVESR